MSIVVKVPYPPNLRFNEKEQAYYNKNKQYVDESVKDELASNKRYREEKYRSGVVIYKKQITADVVYKRVAQIEWDTGISKDRPYTYNEGFVLEKMKKIKELISNEPDETKQGNQKKVLVGLMPKLQQARDVDKVEGVTIPREMKGMETEEGYTRTYNFKKRIAEDREERRLQAIEAYKRQEVLDKQRAKETAENEMMEQADKPALKQKSRDAVSRQYSYIVDKLPTLEKYKQQYWIRTAYAPLTDITESLVATLQNGVLIGDIELIEELIKLVEMLPKKNGDPIMKDLSDFIEKKIVELNPEIQKLEPITKELRYGKDSLFKGEDINKSLKTPLWRSIQSVSNYAFKFKQAVEDIIRWKKQRQEKEKKGGGLNEYTNSKIAKKNAVKYLGKNVVLKPSTKKDKKFMVLNPVTNKFIHFGQLGFEDFTKHQDLKRQKSYLNRTGNMRGDWKDDKYSANNLAREILWR